MKGFKKIICLLLTLALFSLSACELGTGTGGNSGMGGGADYPHDHGDGNEDGLCDVCLDPFKDSSDGGDTGDGEGDGDGDGEFILVDFYAINDLHGKLFDGSGHPGTDELTTYLSKMKESDDETVVLSTGDMWQGSAEAILSGGMIITDWLDEIGCVSMTLGNHEFDRGDGAIKENRAISDFPFLAINVYDKSTGERAEYCEPSVFLEFDGYEVGIIGAIGDCYSSIASEQVENVYFKVGRDLTSLVMAESDRLRSMGADIIVYSLHDGYGRSSNGFVSSSNLSSYYDVALSDGYVDLVFEGHTHQSYVLEDQYGVYHLQGGGDNDGITHAELRLNLSSGEVRTTEANFVRTSVYDDLEPDPVLDELKEIYYDEIAPGFELLGNNTARRYSDYLCDTVAELYAKFGEEHWGDYDVVLGGGFLQARAPYELYIGDVYYKHLLEIFPFDNLLTLCKIDGATLSRRFINTTNGSYSVAFTEYGEALGEIKPNEYYYIVVDSYTASYAPNRLTVVEVYDEPVYARDLLADFIRDGGFDEQ